MSKIYGRIKSILKIKYIVIAILFVAVLVVAISMPEIYGQLSNKHAIGEITTVDADNAEDTINSDLSLEAKFSILNSKDVVVRVVNSVTAYDDFITTHNASYVSMLRVIDDLANRHLIGTTLSADDISSSFIYADYVVISSQSDPLNVFYAWLIRLDAYKYNYYILFGEDNDIVYKISFETTYANDYLFTSNFANGLSQNIFKTNSNNNGGLYFDENFLEYYGAILNRYYTADSCYVDSVYENGARYGILYNSDSSGNNVVTEIQYDNDDLSQANEKIEQIVIEVNDINNKSYGTLYFPVYLEIAVGDRGYAAFNLMAGEYTGKVINSITSFH